MNILLINKFFWRKGGSETVFFGEMGLLESHGHKVIPFSMQDDRNLPSQYSEYFVDNIDYDTAGKLAKIKAASRIIYSTEACRKIKRLLKHEQIDVAHFHIFQHQISPSVFGPLRKAGIPIILTLHDLKPICPNYLMYTQGDICEKCKGRKFYNCVINKCTKNSTAKSFINMVEMYFHYAMGYYQNVDRYIAVSNFYRNKMIEFGFDSNQVRHIPNFIDTDKFSYKEQDEGYGLYFGRLSSEKGLTTLLEACALRPDIPMVIAGTGPQEEEFRQNAIDLRLKNVKFVGFKGGDELVELLSRASFSVIPSSWYENCPMSLLESMAVGTPVIGTRHGGIPELIEENTDGYTFERKNARDLAEKMGSLWSNPDLRMNMGRKGAAKVAARHDPEKHYGHLITEYQKITGSLK